MHIDINLVVNNENFARRNAKRWNDALAIGRTPLLPDGRIYISDHINFPPVNGCGKYVTEGSFSYPIRDNQYDIKGSATEVWRLGKGPAFRLAGVGAGCLDPITLVGDGESTAIEIEGRSHPSTGRHTFANITFHNWGCAFKALGGYYEKGKFVKDENHADNLSFTNCHAFNVPVFYRSENEQAVNIVFDRCGIWDHGKPEEAFDCIFCDLERGGLVTINNPVGSASRLTLFRVNWFSPNSNRLICHEYHGDRMPVKGWRFTPIEYVETPDRPRAYGSSEIVPGPDWQTKACDYEFEFSGFIAKYLTEEEKAAGIECCIETRVPKDFPRGKWKVPEWVK